MLCTCTHLGTDIDCRLQDRVFLAMLYNYRSSLHCYLYAMLYPRSAFPPFFFTLSPHFVLLDLKSQTSPAVSYSG